MDKLFRDASKIYFFNETRKIILKISFNTDDIELLKVIILFEGGYADYGKLNVIKVFWVHLKFKYISK